MWVNTFTRPLCEKVLSLISCPIPLQHTDQGPLHAGSFLGRLPWVVLHTQLAVPRLRRAELAGTRGPCLKGSHEDRQKSVFQLIFSSLRFMFL